MKQAYKQMKIPMGVFQVKNIENGKILIDHSIDMESKWNRHQMELKFGNHRNKDLQKDWNASSSSNFIYEVLSELKQNDDEGVNINGELKILQKMLIEDLHIHNTY